MNAPSPFTARARTDARDWLVEADEPLAGLQLRAGGELPGLIVSPALLALVRKARTEGLKLVRTINAQDDDERVTAQVEVIPDDEGCVLSIAHWQSEVLDGGQAPDRARYRAAIVAQTAELSARLDSGQRLLAIDCRAPDLTRLAQTMGEGAGHAWTDYVDVEGQRLASPRNWHLLDGAQVSVPDSQRSWRAHLVPQDRALSGAAGFELHLVADAPLARAAPEPAALPAAPASAGIGREIAPVLRQPIARIIANAETIRTKLAGPLADEYSDYAADISNAGEHLLALLDDLIALEAVEDEHFAPAPDPIDLADLARRAAGILAMRARERQIEIIAPAVGERAPAIGEFRRVLQILLNLVGNAIRYSPEGSRVTLTVASAGDRARLVVTDEGEGLSDAQLNRLFEKFERLGRSGDGGTGLGLYISRRLARAMGGDLTVASAAGEGARFTLDLPADPDR